MSSQELAILHIEDDPYDADLIHRQLQRKGLACEIRRVLSREDFVRALNEEKFDLILSDYTIPGFDGATALELAREICPDTPFIFLSGTIGEERAVSILKRGASDYVLKDNLTRLPSIIERTLREASLKRERQKAESTLQETRHFIQRITDTVPDVLYVFDLLRERTVYVSGKIDTVLGYSAAEIMENESPVSDLVHPEDQPTVEEFLKSFTDASDEDVVELDVRLRHAGKNWRWYGLRGTVFARDHHHKPTQILGTIQDITRRRQAAEKLRQQATLLEIARDAILILDLDLKIRFWNQAAESLYGWPRDEILARPHSTLFFEEGRDVSEIKNHLLEHGEWFGEMRHQTRDGKEVIVQSRWSLASDKKPGSSSILVINTDVTEKKNLENQFLRAQRLESIGALAGGVAHDLNNILSPILMGAEILREHLGDEEDVKIMDTVLSSARRGAELVRQVLTFAKGAQGQVASVELNKIMSEIVTITRGTFPRSIAVHQEGAPDLWPVRGDVTNIHQILLNLCVNARDAMPSGGRLGLLAQNVVLDEKTAASIPGAAVGSFVALSISDTGIGIDEKTRGKIFDPFFTTKDAGHGTGLGLATVQSLVKAHEGFLALDSIPGEGTTFTVYLPADRSADSQDPDSPAIEVRRGNDELILIIDDETTIIDITRETLKSFGYRVMTAKDGAEGLALYAQNESEIAAVITDTSMPVLDGPATVRALRRMAPDLPIIAAAGFLQEGTLDEYTELKIARILRKPFTTAQLLIAVRTVLDQ